MADITSEQQTLADKIMAKRCRGRDEVVKVILYQTLQPLPADVLSWIWDTRLSFLLPGKGPLGICFSGKWLTTKEGKACDLIYLSPKLGKLDIKDAQWVVAHEIGHSFAKYHDESLLFGQREKNEEAANAKAAEWGFTKCWDRMWAKC